MYDLVLKNCNVINENVESQVDIAIKNQRIEKIAAVAVNITKVLIIFYLGIVEVFKIGKSLRDKLDFEFDISRKWATQTYSILKKRQAERKVAGV